LVRQVARGKEPLS